MNKAAATRFRRERADELKKLGDLLTRKAVLQDAEPLLSAAARCNNTPSSFPKEFQSAKERRGLEFWAYQVNDLLFRGVDEDCLRHSIPNKLSDVTITLNINLCGVCVDDNPQIISNPFVELAVNIETSAQDVKKNAVKCAWHLDKNIAEKGDAASKFAHPDYHFQHGGIKIRNLTDYGENLFLDVPRLAHPPLDGILAVDFVLSNYFGSKWGDLRADSEYQKIVRAAQERCWTAYAFSTAMEWKSPVNWQTHNFDHNWKANIIWPQVINKNVNV